jgi:hypothetical protein
MTRSGAKSEWWAEREALDDRLRDLLLNIENIWLGGFRGIFSQYPRHQELLSRFQSSFQKILDKHLPSRRKVGKRNKTSYLSLDPRILELFIGLGNPSRVKYDLDEPLTDLLYFVVDILQFHGERNAYDEIDFDAVRYLAQVRLWNANVSRLLWRHKTRFDATTRLPAPKQLTMAPTIQSLSWTSLCTYFPGSRYRA